MNDSFELLKEKSSHVGLHPDERQSLKSFLSEYIDSHPIQEPEPEHSSASPFSKYKRVGAFALVVALLGSSISFASERSLPGDILYPIKIGFTERVRGIFALTQKSKAELEIQLVDRRLAEAEALQDESRLSTGMKAAVLDGFSKHMKAVGTHVAKMSEQKEYADAQAATYYLETSLRSHARILPVLSLTTTSAFESSSTPDQLNSHN